MSFELIASTITVVSFITFAGIVWWALSGRRKGAFAQASQLPFALSDEWEDLPPKEGKFHE